ncbi:MAG: hypothetical protein M5U30_03215 [Burkholderiaceae bacterium]|nr:hypothetical protein [Burkholderiaceae bacterium]
MRSIIDQTTLAIRQRCASNFSGVSIVPSISCQTSFAARTLAMSFGTNCFGTWQSGQPARTPDGFE